MVKEAEVSVRLSREHINTRCEGSGRSLQPSRGGPHISSWLGRKSYVKAFEKYFKTEVVIVWVDGGGGIGW